MKDIINKYIQLLDGITPEEWIELIELIDNKMKLPDKKETISISQAAEIMGKAPHFIRLCLRDGTLPFGIAKKLPGSNRWSYYISPKLFYDYVGKERQTHE